MKMVKHPSPRSYWDYKISRDNKGKAVWIRIILKETRNPNFSYSEKNGIAQALVTMLRDKELAQSFYTTPLLIIDIDAVNSFIAERLHLNELISLIIMEKAHRSIVVNPTQEIFITTNNERQQRVINEHIAEHNRKYNHQSQIFSTSSIPEDLFNINYHREMRAIWYAQQEEEKSRFQPKEDGKNIGEGRVVPMGEVVETVEVFGVIGEQKMVRAS